MRATAGRASSPAAAERRRVRTPVLAVTALAWVTTLIGPLASLAHSGAMHSTDMAMGASAHSGAMTQMSTDVSAGSLPGLLGMWLLMLAAMMSPVLIGPLRHLGARSLPGHRFAAQALFVAGYAVIWSIAGVLLLAAADVVDRLASPTGIAVGLAIVWQLTPVKQRCLNGHHIRPSLAAFGFPARLGAARFGVRLGVSCIGSCWALMLLPLVLMDHQLMAMAAITLWIWAEQLEFPALARWRMRVPTRAILVCRAATTRLIRPRPAQ
jgi:predicted metal-binding membrane protein